MRVRGAIEADAEALASMTGRPRDVVVDMVHDRSVRVAVTGTESAGETSAGETAAGEAARGETAAGEAARGGDADASESVVGFVAFDARDGTVHVTTVGGDGDAVERLFEEPVRFARREGMAVEAVVPADGTASETAAAAGFEAVGAGPRLDGEPTTRYRLDPSDGD